eukprot:2060914-Amphidinium_carterae.2
METVFQLLPWAGPSAIQVRTGGMNGLSCADLLSCYHKIRLTEWQEPIVANRIFVLFTVCSASEQQPQFSR